jgi:hypothetical protein
MSSRETSTHSRSRSTHQAPNLDESPTLLYDSPRTSSPRNASPRSPLSASPPKVYDEEKIRRHSPRTQTRHSPRTLESYSPRTLKALTAYSGNKHYQETVNKATYTRRALAANLYMGIGNTLNQKGWHIFTEQPVDVFGPLEPPLASVGEFNFGDIKKNVYVLADWSPFVTDEHGHFQILNAEGEVVPQAQLRSTMARRLRSMAARYLPTYLYNPGTNSWSYEVLLQNMRKYNDIAARKQAANSIRGGTRKRGKARRRVKKSRKHRQKGG